MKYRDFEDLPIWKQAMSLVTEINLLTRGSSFARDFALKDQIRRASVSISSNIAEGFERCSNKEFVRFLYYAKGSASEVRTQLLIARQLNYLDDRQYIQLRNKSKALAISIGKFISYFNHHFEKNLSE